MSGLDQILSLDVLDLTLGEMELVEEATGMGFEEAFLLLGKPGPKAKILTAMAFVIKRREDPEITLDAVKQIKVLLEGEDPKE